MGSSAGRAKRDREKARQEKQAIKRERRQGGAIDLVDEPTDDADPSIRRPQDDVLADLARLHQRFDDEAMEFEDFETAKRELIAQLDIG